MLSRFRELRNDEDGQAIVVAAIGLLILAFAVLGTATLGNAIHEKVRLQNAADSAAYSTAALEARAFNYYAFTNRTMVSHYVAIMTLQSYLAVAGFIMSAVNTARLIVRAMRQFCRSTCGRPVCAAIRMIPGVGTILALIQQLLRIIDEALQLAGNALQNLLWGTRERPAYPLPRLNLDRIIGYYAIPFFVLLNHILYVSQVAVMYATSLTLTAMGGQSVTGSYDGVRPEPSMTHPIALALLKKTEDDWNRAHDPEAMNLTPYGGGGKHAVTQRLERRMDQVDPGIQRAERVMSEISNATRWNRFVFNRSLGGSLSGSVLDILSTASFGLFNFELHGTTKMITESRPVWDLRQRDNFDDHDLRGGGQRKDGHKSLTQGGSVVGDQWLEVRFLFLQYNMTEDELKLPFFKKKFSPGVRHSAVAASHKDFNGDRWGWHCVTHLTPPNKDMCILKAIICLCKLKDIYKIDVGKSRCYGPEPNEPAGSKGYHPWWGVVPFMKFNPEPDGSPSVAFHQPSTWSWLHQTPDNIDLEPLLQKDVLGLGGHSAEHDTGVAHVTEGFLAPGFHAVARGQVYYHRVGNWREHPNFFNPFWRPKLAPIQPVLNDVLGDIGLGGFFTNSLTKSMITH